MEENLKELLLKDLCARLPYRVIVKLDDKFKFNKGDRVLVKELLDLYCVEGIKPYLRPMSSMTADERKEFERFSHLSIGLAPILMDWIYSHHLDCCGLIEKNLALEAPNGMYKIKDK